MTINLTAVCITAIICLTIGSIFTAAFKYDAKRNDDPKQRGEK